MKAVSYKRMTYTSKPIAFSIKELPDGHGVLELQFTTDYAKKNFLQGELNNLFASSEGNKVLSVVGGMINICKSDVEKVWAIKFNDPNLVDPFIEFCNIKKECYEKSNKGELKLTLANKIVTLIDLSDNTPIPVLVQSLYHQLVNKLHESFSNNEVINILDAKPGDPLRDAGINVITDLINGNKYYKPVLGNDIQNLFANDNPIDNVFYQFGAAGLFLDVMNKNHTYEVTSAGEVIVTEDIY